MAWHVAALMRVKKGRLPSIDDLLGVKRGPVVQTPDEMKSVFAAIRMQMQ